MTDRLIDRVGDEFKIARPIFLQHLSSRLVEKAGEEIARGEIMLLNSHSLMKATAKAAIRESQKLLILIEKWLDKK